MSSLQGGCVVAWLERWGERFLKGSQPEIYHHLLLHVGGTDILRGCCRTGAYWLYVQAILDSFFSGAERAEMCAELLGEPAFRDDPAFAPFLNVARAEIRCRELVAAIEGTADVSASLRSVS
ncbi:MAG: hypothetical protein ACR2P3_04235 [Geminicoccaceae bacterium]